MKAKLLEILALTMIGEGVVGLAFPSCYADFWNMGPKPMRKAISALADHPNLMRVFCAAEVAMGFWLATSQLSADRTSGREKKKDARLTEPLEVTLAHVELIAEVG